MPSPSRATTRPIARASAVEPKTTLLNFMRSAPNAKMMKQPIISGTPTCGVQSRKAIASAALATICSITR